LETEELELSTTVLARYSYADYNISKFKNAKTTFGTVCKISSQAWSMFPGAFDPSIWGAVYGGCNYR
jgi:hypothetical protein